MANKENRINWLSLAFWPYSARQPELKQLG
jgi:hypothetical protein